MSFMHKRTMLAVAAALALLTIPAIAAAHAKFASSTPAPGSSLQTAPTEVRVTFSEEIQPGGSSFTVTDAAGTKVGSGTADLTVADRNVLEGKVTITRPGIYTVKWTSLSIDGDTVTGAFSFGFKASALIPAVTGGEESPNTSVALRATDPSPLALLGALLLLGGTGISARRVALR